MSSRPVRLETCGCGHVMWHAEMCEYCGALSLLMERRQADAARERRRTAKRPERMEPEFVTGSDLTMAPGDQLATSRILSEHNLGARIGYGHYAKTGQGKLEPDERGW